MDKEERILAYIGIIIATILGVINVVIQYCQWANITPSFLEPYAQFIILLLLMIILLILFGLVIYLVRTGKASSNEPNFDHVIAFFFYPKKYSWDKGERDPNKIVPRQKLLLITDLKKAYYFDDFGMELVKNERVRWFSENEQDNLEDWCTKKGYKLVPDNATEEMLLEPCFRAEIVNKKQEYQKLDSVFFRTYYRGKLNYGFFDNMITNTEGKPCSKPRFWRKRKSYAWSWAPDTLKYRYVSLIPNFLIQGELNGYVKHQSEWAWGIQDYVPSGKYKVAMRVYKDRFIAIAMKEIEDTFTVS